MDSDKIMNLNFGIIRGFAAIMASVGIAAVFIFIVSDNPFESLYYMLVSPLSSTRQIFGVFERMIPLMFTGLAVCVMFSANQFNLAAEGCVLLGGLVSALCAIYLQLPAVIHVFVCIFAGAAVCGLVMLIPAALQAKLGANVMVSTLMLNYIILYVCQYFLVNVFADKTQGATVSLPFLPTAVIPKMGYQTSWGFVIGLVTVVVTSLFMYRTRWGYSIRMVGINRKFSGYSGINAIGVIVLCQLIGGILSGMGGSIEVLGYYDRFKWRLLPGYGWNGVTIAILTKNNPVFVPFGAFFLAYLSKGCVNMSIYTNVPAEMLEVIQAAIFLFFAAEKFLSKYRHKMLVKNTRREIERTGSVIAQEADK